ncbi:MAG: PIN domain-containing protein [Nitrospirota bacterium]
MNAQEIAELVEAIVNTPGVEVTDKGIIVSALRLYRNKHIDLIDALITEFAKEREIKTIYTFDKRHFKDINGIEAISP